MIGEVFLSNRISMAPTDSALLVTQVVPANTYHEHEQNQNCRNNPAALANRCGIGRWRRFNLGTVTFDDVDYLSHRPARGGKLLAQCCRNRNFVDGMIRKQIKTDESIDFVGTEGQLLETLYPHLVLLRELW